MIRNQRNGKEDREHLILVPILSIYFVRWSFYDCIQLPLFKFKKVPSPSFLNLKIEEERHFLFLFDSILFYFLRSQSFFKVFQEQEAEDKINFEEWRGNWKRDGRHSKLRSESEKGKKRMEDVFTCHKHSQTQTVPLFSSLTYPFQLPRLILPNGP